ncbi:MAG: hypothetical protein XU08_C0002G0058 [candidate division WWE3 bacterium CSP1-7]|uniref:Prepilin-type N-terminal cleavage/methylation domain-containing protein n=1 Tax=candidate division WWE3 bacterium CSP1-7 TaxID=1576480 RepID=A0A0T5ZXH6_UNCKA|nr:MAG: hypothetical protein XU08_C0002G0058 [candidate division WWE3 bacterium CSP1-7]
MMKRGGFSLLEVLLSVTLIGVIGAFGAPLYLRLQVKNDLDLAAVSVAQSWRRAQVLTQVVEGDSVWGVRVQSGGITLFKGASYAARDSSYDEVFAMPTAISPSGLLETTFSKVFGRAQTTGTMTLTSLNGEAHALTINAYGMVQY